MSLLFAAVVYGFIAVVLIVSLVGCLITACLVYLIVVFAACLVFGVVLILCFSCVAYGLRCVLLVVIN